MTAKRRFGQDARRRLPNNVDHFSSIIIFQFSSNFKFAVTINVICRRHQLWLGKIITYVSSSCFKCSFVKCPFAGFFILIFLFLFLTHLVYCLDTIIKSFCDRKYTIFSGREAPAYFYISVSVKYQSIRGKKTLDIISWSWCIFSFSFIKF